jgi:integrase
MCARMGYRTIRVREGVQERHGRRCGVHDAKACSCVPGYQAQVWSARDGRPLRKTFPSVADAVAWRQETQVAVRQGRMRAPASTTLAEAADEILPQLGRRRLSAVTRNDLQDLVDKLVADGSSASTVRNAILPLRAIYRRATEREQVAVNPTLKLRLPAVRGTRERTARANEAAELIAALSEKDRALWATAFYGGLRRGELQALQWDDVDLDLNLIRVVRSWDAKAGFITPKSRAGKRRVPIPKTLRQYLLAQKLRQGNPDNGFVFANTRGRPFDPATVLVRARKAWRSAGLRPITLHECRHSYAAYMIAARINAKALSTYMGHTSITVTLDRYGHLLPGNEHQAACALEDWLQRQPTAAMKLPGS